MKILIGRISYFEVEICIYLVSVSVFLSRYGQNHGQIFFAWLKTPENADITALF